MTNLHSPEKTSGTSFTQKHGVTIILFINQTNLVFFISILTNVFDSAMTYILGSRIPISILVESFLSFEALLRTYFSSALFVATLWWILWFTSRRFPNLFAAFFSSGFLNWILPPKSESTQDQVGSETHSRPKLIKANFIESRTQTIQELDERIRQLKFRTTTILATIAISLVGATLVVIFAGKLTGLDASAVSNIDKLKTEITDTNRRIFNTSKLADLYSQLEEARKKTSPVAEIEKLQRDIISITGDFSFRGSGSTSAGSGWPIDAPTSLASIEVLKAHLSKLNVLLGDAWEKETKSDHGYADWKYLTATAITRVGVVLIIVFLVQILMGLYRYNTRLIGYYNSRRDLFTLWDGNMRKLRQIDQVLTLPKIEFGKEPKHPLEDIIRAAAAQLSSRKTRPSEK